MSISDLELGDVGTKPHLHIMTLKIICGLSIAALMEGFSGTVLSIAKPYMMGDLHLTLDEFSALDIAYVASKLFGFLLAANLLVNRSMQSFTKNAALLLMFSSVLMVCTTNFYLLILLRSFQGISGACVLVGGQSLLFIKFPKKLQPLIQAIYTIASAVAAVTFAPSIQGWLIDNFSWRYIFFLIFSLGSITFILLKNKDETIVPIELRVMNRINLIGYAVFSFAMAYFLTQGNRWNWLDENKIVLILLIIMATLTALIIRVIISKNNEALVYKSIFADEGFCFGLLVSFVAGAALSGSAFLIPAYLVAVLGYTATDAGVALIPSGLFFICSLLIVGYLVQFKKLSPLKSVPLGILLVMISMWMLSKSNAQTSLESMMPALLTRGLGLGLLLLSVTLVTILNLKPQLISFGVGLFNAGKLIGGMMFVGFLQTHIDHQSAFNRNLLSAHLFSGDAMITSRLAGTANMLASRGVEKGQAIKLAGGILKKSLEVQVKVLSFSSAFQNLVFLFVIAAPIIIIFKISLGKIIKKGVE